MFDYIIVGAGTAGCALTHRLSADPAARVLLLEAGQADTRAEIHIPAAFSRLFKTEVDWAYETEPQPHLANRRLFWPRGKVLGGSSSINAMIYIRGHRADYDGWAARGCTGWGFSDVLPYFKRSEDNARGASAYHGVGGPLRVEDLREPHPLSLRFIEAAQGVGLPANDDFNGAEQEGAGLYQVNQRGGRRESGATAFLKPIRHRDNLTIETGAQATRVLFEGTRAVGIEYVQGGETQQAHAAEEVLLCGGAINSPQLLMLSGVGPVDHLRAQGIEVVADRSEVGSNLQDHLIVGVRYRSKEGGTLLSAESPLNIARYLLTRRGLLTSNVAEAGAFAFTRSGPTPDLQFHVAPVLFAEHGLEPPPEHGFSLGPTLVRTETRGHIRLRSADPFAAPAIDPNYFAHEGDLYTLIEGVRLAREIVAQAAYDGVRGEELTPGPNLKTDAQIAQYIRETAETLYHPVGTCRMGPDTEAVVDLDLRVKGVEGVRVVDASVMPTVVNGNTNAPTLMIAEKAADLIRNGSPVVSEAALAA
ncbi:MAG: choline dehydrogenase [Rhodothermaceae bacterium]|nr:choline dehydrogenase [Rhodothermaceae bacterium]